MPNLHKMHNLRVPSALLPMNASRSLGHLLMSFIYVAGCSQLIVDNRLARSARPSSPRPMCYVIRRRVFNTTRKFWFELLQSGLALLAPQVDSSFDAWWHKAALIVSGDAQKGLNSLIILDAWTI